MQPLHSLSFGLVHKVPREKAGQVRVRIKKFLEIAEIGPKKRDCIVLTGPDINPDELVRQLQTLPPNKTVLVVQGGANHIMHIAGYVRPKTLINLLTRPPKRTVWQLPEKEFRAISIN